MWLTCLMAILILVGQLIYVCIYVSRDIYIYIYTQCNLCIKKQQQQKEDRGDRSLFMQGVRAVKYKKYKLVLVLMRGRSYTDFPSHFPLSLHRWADSFLH